MNGWQKLVLWAAASGALVMGLFPPWTMEAGRFETSVGYGFVGTQHDGRRDGHRMKIDLPRLTVQWITLILVTGGLVTGLKGSRKRRPAATPSRLRNPTSIEDNARALAAMARDVTATPPMAGGATTALTDPLSDLAKEMAACSDPHVSAMPPPRQAAPAVSPPVFQVDVTCWIAMVLTSLLGILVRLPEPPAAFPASHLILVDLVVGVVTRLILAGFLAILAFHAYGKSQVAGRIALVIGCVFVLAAESAAHL